MAILDADHLFDQADYLIVPRLGRPRQVDLRRAISSPYYAVFHTTITAAADEIVGTGGRGSREHALVMRSIDHRTIRMCCVEISKPMPTKPYRAYLPEAGFGQALATYATLFPDLQEERHAADYDSLRSYRTADALGLIRSTRRMTEALRRAVASDRRAFFYLIAFPPKR